MKKRKVQGSAGKICKFCSKRYYRKRYQGRLDRIEKWRDRKFCSRSCANSRKEVSKSWHHTRARQFLKTNCEKCGVSGKLEAHHKEHNYKNDKEDNIQTLCINCHADTHAIPF